MLRTSAARGVHVIRIKALVLGLLAWLAVAGAAWGADKVVLQLKWRHQFQFAGYYAALAQGYYRDAGLEVEIREGGPQVSALDELLAGRADFAVGTSSAVVRRAQGAPLVVLAAVFQHSPAVLLVRRRGSGTPTLFDAQGLRLLDAPDSEDIAAMLLSHAVDYKRMERVPHDGDPRLLAAGKADAMVGYSTNEPFLLDRLGVPYATFSPREHGIDFYGDNLVTLQSQVERQPDRVQAFREASLKGWRYALSHQTEMIELIMARYSQAKSREALVFEALHTVPLIQGDLVELGYQSPQRWQAIAEVFLELGVLPAARLPDGLMYDPDARAAEERLRRVVVLSVAAVMAALLVLASVWSLNRRLRQQVRQREAAERRAETLRREFLAMADALPVAAYRSRIWPDGRTEAPYVGLEAERILGVPIAELRADPTSRWRNVVPEDADVPRRLVAEAMARVRAGESGVRLVIEARVQHGGRLHWVKSTAVAEAAFDDGSVSWNGYFEDITERHLAQSALDAERRRLQQTLDAAPVGVAIVQGGVAVLTNPRMRELVYLSGEVEPSAFVDADAARVLHETVRREGMVRDFEIQVRGPHGEIRDVLATYLPTEFNGQPADLAWLVDVSGLKAVQKALEAARAMAEDATHAKSTFLANMSHEIRTPMNAIIGMSHLALRTELSPRQRDYLTKIQQAGGTLLALIDGILDFSKIEAGRMVLESTDFDLAEVLRHLALVTAGRAGDKDLEYLLDVAADVPVALRGDPLRLGQVLVNLVGNAFKFTESGEVRVTVQCLQADDEHVRLRFEVRDTGIGITPEQAERLFQAFAQADDSTTRRFGGSGLGLSICKRLVEMMGGTIGFDSTPGVGSTFAFDACFLRALGRPAPGAVVPGVLNGMRVLVVDDNASARQVMGEALARLPLVVHSADSGESALQWLAGGTHEVDLALVDWRMPGMDGIELTRRLKRELDPPPRVILVTAHDGEEVRQQAEAAGADGFLAKPIEPSQLVDALISLPAPIVDAPALERLPAFDGARVLVVDDNENNRQIACELLASAGVETETAVDGRAALARVHGEGPPFDLVLMDVQMPVMGGYEATRALRADPRSATLPIIAMTAHATAQARERSLAEGMDDHISKPIEPRRFYATLEHWLHAAGRAAAPVRLPTGLALPPASAGAEAAVRALPGLDVETGLSRVLGRWSVYEEMLRRFRSGDADAVATTRQALAEGRQADARRTMHTLKSTAATVGHAAIAALAGELETRLEAGEAAPALEPVLQQAAQALAQFFAALDRALPPPAAVAPAAAVDRAALGATLDELERLLERDDVRSAELWSAHAAELKAALGPHHAPIEREVASYAMPEALQALRAARAALDLVSRR